MLRMTTSGALRALCGCMSHIVAQKPWDRWLYLDGPFRLYDKGADSDGYVDFEMKMANHGSCEEKERTTLQIFTAPYFYVENESKA